MSIYKGTSLLAGLPDVSGKANTDMDNLSNTGKSLIAGLGMPSNTYDDLTLLASGQTYTAPANGYFGIVKIFGSGAFIGIDLFDENQNVMYADYRYKYGSDSTSAGTILVPVKKGGTIGINYNANGSTNIFRFIYAEGEPNV